MQGPVTCRFNTELETCVTAATYLRYECARDSVTDAEQSLSRICLRLAQSFFQVPWLC